jgi:hypothetical protein
MRVRFFSPLLLAAAAILFAEFATPVGATVVQAAERGAGGGRAFAGSGGREWFFGGGGARGPDIGGGGFRAQPSPRGYGWSDGGSRSFGKPHVGSHGFRFNGEKPDVFRGDHRRSWAHDFDGRKVFHHHKFDADRKFDDDRFFHKRRRTLFFVGPVFADDNAYGCEWLRWNAIQTGSPYWWRRYEWCRNGWDW